jgi:hypothetical protein
LKKEIRRVKNYKPKTPHSAGFLVTWVEHPAEVLSLSKDGSGTTYQKEPLGALFGIQITLTRPEVRKVKDHKPKPAEEAGFGI